MKMKKSDTKNVQNPSLPNSSRWERSKKEMTEEEVEKFKNMNWEWYYNCYLYLDEPLEIMCKICGGLNIFLPREMKKKCGHCGIECHRCEMKEKENSKTFQPEE
jgi:hypothetical protein